MSFSSSITGSKAEDRDYGRQLGCLPLFHLLLLLSSFSSSSNNSTSSSDTTVDGILLLVDEDSTIAVGVDDPNAIHTEQDTADAFDVVIDRC